MPIDASIALQGAPPQANPLNTLMSVFELQNAQRTTELNSLKVQQAQRMDSERNALGAALRVRPELIDPESGLLNAQGSSFVLQNAPTIAPDILKANQEAARAHYEGINAQNTAARTQQDIKAKYGATMSSALDFTRQAGFSDASLDQAEQMMLSQGIPKEFLGGVELVKKQPPESREAFVSALQAGNPEAMKLVEDHAKQVRDRNFSTSHGGMDQGNVVAMRNEDVSQAGQNARTQQTLASEEARAKATRDQAADVGLQARLKGAEADATATATNRVKSGESFKVSLDAMDSNLATLQDLRSKLKEGKELDSSRYYAPLSDALLPEPAQNLSKQGAGAIQGLVAALHGMGAQVRFAGPEIKFFQGATVDPRVNRDVNLKTLDALIAHAEHVRSLAQKHLESLSAPTSSGASGEIVYVRRNGKLVPEGSP